MKRLFTPQRIAVATKKLVAGSQFATVGALGLVINQVVLWLLMDVIHFQHLGRIRMTLLPTLQSRERVFLVLRLRHGDQRLR